MSPNMTHTPARLAALALALAIPAARADEPPQTVSTIVASRQPWQPHLDAVGNLRAVRGADLSAEIAGIVDTIDFSSGADVKAGDVLLRLRLDDEPARLAQLQASADLAAINFARDQRENVAQAVSHAVVDADRATLAVDRAQVTAEQALIDEKIVRAPFDGRLGLRQVDLGQYLQPGTAIVTLQSLDPIYIDFYVPQSQLAGIAIGENASFSVDTYPGRGFTARIIAIAPRVDQASRTAQVRATLANPDAALRPGMFATVRLDTGRPAMRVTLPQTAITFATYGSTVFVVRPGPGGASVAHQQLVETGPDRGDQVAILSGLNGGETVVTAGQLKLHEGTPVVIDNRITPRASSNPTPAEE
jgi:membrane fusion protein (multidrug efflux system)